MLVITGPDFKFTSIQVNKNSTSKLHVDGANLGPSMIVGVGDCMYLRGMTCGFLMVNFGLTRNNLLFAVTATDEDGGLWTQPDGELDCRHSWQEFDGNLPHCTLPFTGARRDSPAAPCVGCSSSPCTPAHRSVSVGQASAFRWCTSPTSATRIANMPTRAMPCVS
jgi:hypothetical protein